jgi:hypothetical protein
VDTCTFGIKNHHIYGCRIVTSQNVAGVSEKLIPTARCFIVDRKGGESYPTLVDLHTGAYLGCTLYVG